MLEEVVNDCDAVPDKTLVYDFLAIRNIGEADVKGIFLQGQRRHTYIHIILPYHVQWDHECITNHDWQFKAVNDIAKNFGASWMFWIFVRSKSSLFLCFTH